MRIRQFIAALMVLLSLTAQARIAYGCGMMPASAPAECCCPADAKDHCPQGAAHGACCDLVSPADAPFAHSATGPSGKHAPHAAAQPVAFGPAPQRLPASFDSGARPWPDHAQAVAASAPLPLYLLTARLRL